MTGAGHYGSVTWVNGRVKASVLGNKATNRTVCFFRYKYINIIWLCCNCLAMSNSCYNPFIYGLVNVSTFAAYILKLTFDDLKVCTRISQSLVVRKVAKFSGYIE